MTEGPIAVWNPTLIQCITDALVTVGAIQEGETPTGDDITVAMRKIQNWIKERQASGLHVWAEEEGILFLQAGQYRYNLGPGTTDHACDAFGYTLATLGVSAAAGANAITVASIAGLGAGDNIGVVLDSGSTFWTTVNGAPAGTTVNLTAPLPSSAGSGNLAFDYAAGTDIGRPLDVPKSRYLTWQGMSEVPMTRYSRQVYMDLPNKANPGVPSIWAYFPVLNQGQYFVWNMPQNAAYAARFTWYRSLGDWTLPGATSDFPQEWASAIEWNLAEEVMVGYEVPQLKAVMISTMAKQKLDLVTGYDREAEDIQFGIDHRWE